MPHSPPPEVQTLICPTGRVFCSPGTWHALAINAGGFVSASGFVPFRFERDMPVKMMGGPSEFRGRPTFAFSHIEQLPVEFYIAPALALSRHGIPASQSKKLIATFGDDCIAKVAADPDILAATGLRFRPTSCDKIVAACRAVQALDRVETALLQCGVSNEAIPEILDRWNEKRNHYALVLAGHLSFVLADHLAQTTLVQGRTPFDQDGVPRAVGVLAQVLNNARRNGHCGASCQSLESAARH